MILRLSSSMLPPVASRAFSSTTTTTTISKKVYASNLNLKSTNATSNKVKSTSISVNTTTTSQSFAIPTNLSLGLKSVKKNISSSTKTSNKQNFVIGPQLEHDKGRLTVVLDVDETLIHSRLSSVQDRFRQDEERKDVSSLSQSCEEFKITLEDGETIWVNKRPGLDKFLQTMSERYETIAYTAALEEYAKPLLDWLDPHGKIFRHRLYRDSCLFVRGYYVKDLAKMNRCLKRTVLVDNNAFCFLPQLSNGIPISSFYDDPNDNALSVLTTFLERLEDEKDVRPLLNKSFNLQTLLKEHRDHIIGC